MYSNLSEHECISQLEILISVDNTWHEALLIGFWVSLISPISVSEPPKYPPTKWWIWNRMGLRASHFEMPQITVSWSWHHFQFLLRQYKSLLLRGEHSIGRWEIPIIFWWEWLGGDWDGKGKVRIAGPRWQQKGTATKMQLCLCFYLCSEFGQIEVLSQGRTSCQAGWVMFALRA